MKWCFLAAHTIRWDQQDITAAKALVKPRDANSGRSTKAKFEVRSRTHPFFILFYCVNDTFHVCIITKFVEVCYRRQTNLAFSISRLITSTSVRIPGSSSHEGSTRDSLKEKPGHVQKSLLIWFVRPRPLKFQVHPQPHRVLPGSALEQQTQNWFLWELGTGNLEFRELSPAWVGKPSRDPPQEFEYWSNSFAWHPKCWFHAKAATH